MSEVQSLIKEDSLRYRCSRYRELTVYYAFVFSNSGGGLVERRCWTNFQCRGVLLVWMMVGQGLIALAVGAGWGLFGHFFLSSIFSLFFLPLFGRRPDID